MSSPSTPPRHRQLTRDERLQIQTLRLAGHTQKFIADLLGISRRQVGYAITTNCLTPSKRSGRPPHLTNEQVDELEAFVNQTPANREMTYRQLAQGPFVHWGVSEYVIQRALRSRGVARHPERVSHTSSSKAIKIKPSTDGLQASMNGMQTKVERLPSSTHPLHTPADTSRTPTETLPSSTHPINCQINALQPPMNPSHPSMNMFQTSMEGLQTPINPIKPLQALTENSLTKITTSHTPHKIPQATMYESQPQNNGGSQQPMRHSALNSLDELRPQNNSSLQQPMSHSTQTPPDELQPQNNGGLQQPMNHSSLNSLDEFQPRNNGGLQPPMSHPTQTLQDELQIKTENNRATSYNVHIHADSI